MSLAMLRQNAEILLEVSENYENLLQKLKNANKEEAIRYETNLKNFRNQFLYLLTSMHKLVEQEKNVK